MKQIPFARGVGLGISVGVALGKTIKAVSDVMEDLTDAIGL